jgi:hypothetical protein
VRPARRLAGAAGRILPRHAAAGSGGHERVQGRHAARHLGASAVSYGPNDTILIKEYDTTVSGKANTGHTYGADLCPDTSGLDAIADRKEIETRLLQSRVGALLAYLKTL